MVQCGHWLPHVLVHLPWTHRSALQPPDQLTANTALHCSFSFGVVLWELLTWRLPWAGSGLSPFQVGGAALGMGVLADGATLLMAAAFMTDML